MAYLRVGLIHKFLQCNYMQILVLYSSFLNKLFKVFVIYSRREKKGPNTGFSLQVFLWESLGLLQPKVEGPEEKSGGPTFIIVLKSRRTVQYFGR